VTALLVAVGAALGALARHLTQHVLATRRPSKFPWAVLAVNLVGSLLLGAVLAAAQDGGLSDQLATGLGVGFCGALTTYSTFSYDTLRLVEERTYVLAVASVLLNVVGSVLAAAAGWALLS
jgi:CrcB protein